MWRREFEIAGYEAVAAAVQSRAEGPLVYAPGFGTKAKREEAARWVKEQAEERSRQRQRAEADRREARWHSWTNTVVAVLALIVALVALFMG
jgi:hypothetical protein